MLGLALALAIFVFCGVVGYALVLLTAGERDETYVLFSPAIGAAVIILITMFVNYFGAPVRSFGPILALVLLCAAAVVLWRTRPHRFSRRLGVIAAILVVALLLTGRPFLEFGLDWLSYVNDDMNTYVFGATRMFEHGFLVVPDPHAYVQNREAIESFYSLDVLYNNRTGVENLLAFWMAVLRSDGYHVFMPLIVALQLMMIAAATGLACIRSTDARVAIATAGALAASALVTLGTDLQLIAQVCGLALMAVSLGLICQPPPDRPRSSFVRRGLLCSVPLAAFAAVYPEMFPLLAIAVAAFLGFGIVRKEISAPRTIAWLGALAAATAVLLNVHISTFLEMISIIMSFGQGAGLAPASFPYFLLPSGLPNLFGLIPVATGVPEPLLSLSVAAGLALFVAALLATAFSVARREVVGYGTLALLLIIPLLARHQNGFALYKLAMYFQPFLIPTLVIWWARWPPFARLRREPVPA